jgi:hypothetical protein
MESENYRRSFALQIVKLKASYNQIILSLGKSFVGDIRYGDLEVIVK